MSTTTVSLGVLVSVTVALSAGCEPNDEKLETAATAIEKSAEICLLTVRDQRTKYQDTAACSALGGLSYRYLEAGGDMRGKTPAKYDLRYIPDSEIATYFSAADVVLAPYRVEAQSGVALTAFHFARPVIASRVGGLPEIVRDGINGYLVPTEDPDALANAIDRFFSESDRGSMEHAAAETAKANSWEDYASAFVRLVERP